MIVCTLSNTISRKARSLVKNSTSILDSFSGYTCDYIVLWVPRNNENQIDNRSKITWSLKLQARISSHQKKSLGSSGGPVPSSRQPPNDNPERVRIRQLKSVLTSHRPLPVAVRGSPWHLRTPHERATPGAAARRRSGTRDARQVRRPRAAARHAGGWVDVTPARARWQT